MNKFRIVPYEKSYYDKWNEFVDNSINGTLFHRLDFLEYHDESLSKMMHHIIWLKGEHIFGLMPMAIITENGRKIARSPYGASYGGLVLKDNPGYNKSILFVKQLLDYCSNIEVDEIRLTPPIQAAYKEYSETLYFALLETGFTILNADISNVLEYKRDIWSSFQGTLRRTINKTEEYPLSYRIDAPLDDFIVPFKKTFEKHETNPTHSHRELKWLKDKFPDRIIFDVAYYKDIPVSGVGRFVLNKRLDSSFYLCNDPDYEHLQSLSYLIHKSLLDSEKNGFRAFEFGTSSVNMNGRENIFRFKERFGATGQFRKTFVWKKKEN